MEGRNQEQPRLHKGPTSSNQLGSQGWRQPGLASHQEAGSIVGGARPDPTPRSEPGPSPCTLSALPSPLSHLDCFSPPSSPPECRSNHLHSAEEAAEDQRDHVTCSRSPSKSVKDPELTQSLIPCLPSSPLPWPRTPAGCSPEACPAVLCPSKLPAQGLLRAAC